ncbi:MAG: phosphoglycerate kinase [Candidatus Sungbacteria bacterium]|nr:phosphoglycerate kinase [Candidatus Sungbacteria bacterium]
MLTFNGIRWIKPKNPAGKRVLVRVDFNVPIKNGKIEDDFRIKAHLPTLHALLKGQNTVIILTHIGKPAGKKIPAFSARPIARRLSKLLKRRVTLISNPFTLPAARTIKNAPAGSIFVIENLRFWNGEEKKDETFANNLSRLGDVFVQDAFGVIHRAHASITRLPFLLPSYGGLLLKKELTALKPLATNPKRPFVVIMGGVKISTKLALIRAFSQKADRVLLGGALANTILAALASPVGKSVIEKKTIPAVKRMLANGTKLVFPKDAVVASTQNARRGTKKLIADIAKTEIILDIGPETATAFIRELNRAKTIFWNGPLGFVENNAFRAGTLKVARAIHKLRCYKVIGGGDLIAFFHKRNLASRISHFATGGGSTLTLLAGKKLPGLEALKKAKR